MAPGYASLALEAIVLLEKFSVSRLCLDDFVEDAAKDMQGLDTLHKNFTLDVVSGCVEHKKLLDVVIKVFYGQNGKCLSRGDRSQFVVICYLATCALDDIGLQCFISIVKSLDKKKMHMFLSFFFANLTTWIQEEWNTIYDAAYVETTWIEPLLRWRPKINIFLDQLSLKISQGDQIKKGPVKTTEPKEFSLTKPKPPALPLPEIIPQQEQSKSVKFKPIPNSTYKPSKEMQVLEGIKQKNHQKAEELLYEANMKQFRCGNTQKSERTKKVMSQIKEDLDSKLKFNTVHSSGPPSSRKTDSWPIKLNNAAILRQGALYKRQEEEEVQRLERLIEEAREPTSFLQEQTTAERRHLERRISYEVEAMARTRLMERNQKTAQRKKEEAAELMQKYIEKRLQEEKEMRDLVQQVSEGHKNSNVAKERIQKFKQSLVKEVSEQSQAIEPLPDVTVKHFDDTQTAGHRLLGEMSLCELRERLALLKEVQQAEQQGKQEQILEEKQRKQQMLLEQLETIDLRRRERAQAAAIRKEERKSRPSIRQAVSQGDTVLARQRKLEAKQQEHQRLKQIEGKRAKTSGQAATHPVKNTEAQNKREINWEELELSLEHHIQKETPYAIH
ncbi:cilia- and flagella-associated protein 99 isoform X2 [Halichoeres trimaculatus]|uniref:cilia- and flagella-associated protein 99 isoform X2 n=1 Tax=Halichoeres trimaculatus TaxID=147232 RepID=UPI003D9FB056